MLRTLFGAVAGLAAFAAFDAPRAAAQPQVPAGPASRPVFSPYLNLLGGYNNPALNYFGIVQPQLQIQQQLAQLQQTTFAGPATGQGGDASLLLPTTGTVPVFNSTFGYFNRLYVGSGAVSGGSAGGSTSGGAFNRLGGSFGGSAAGGARPAGFQPGGVGGGGSGGLRPSFAAPSSGVRAPAGGAGAPPR